MNNILILATIRKNEENFTMPVIIVIVIVIIRKLRIYMSDEFIINLMPACLPFPCQNYNSNDTFRPILIATREYFHPQKIGIIICSMIQACYDESVE